MWGSVAVRARDTSVAIGTALGRLRVALAAGLALLGTRVVLVGVRASLG